MDTILKEIAVLPGVMGSLVISKDSGILYSSLPAAFTDEMISEASSFIRRMIQMAQVKELDPQSISIKYSQFDLLAMQLNPLILLITFCDPETNTPLVATTTCMLAPELIKSISNHPAKEQQGQISSKNDADNGALKQPDRQKTNEALKLLKKSLLETVGPFADFVYEECYEQWIGDNPADISRILEFITCLSHEIDSPELEEEFKTKIASLL